MRCGDRLIKRPVLLLNGGLFATAGVRVRAGAHVLRRADAGELLEDRSRRTAVHGGATGIRLAAGRRFAAHLALAFQVLLAFADLPDLVGELLLHARTRLYTVVERKVRADQRRGVRMVIRMMIVVVIVVIVGEIGQLTVR